MLHPDVAATLNIMLPGDPLSPEHQDAVNRARALRPQFTESLGSNWGPQHPWLSQGSEVPAPMPSENMNYGYMSMMDNLPDPMEYEYRNYTPTAPTGPSWVDHGGPDLPMPDKSEPRWEEPADLPLQNRGQLPWESDWERSMIHGFEVAGEPWREPYIKEWQKHWNKNDPYKVTDPERLKNLQDIVIFHRP